MVARFEECESQRDIKPDLVTLMEILFLPLPGKNGIDEDDP